MEKLSKNIFILLNHLLNCGELEIKELTKWNSESLINALKNVDSKTTYNSIIADMITNEIETLNQIVINRITDLKNYTDLTESEIKELEEIKKLNAYEDITNYVNGSLDTHIYCNDNKLEIYKKYFEEQIDTFEDNLNMEFNV